MWPMLQTSWLSVCLSVCLGVSVRDGCDQHSCCWFITNFADLFYSWYCCPLSKMFCVLFSALMQLIRQQEQSACRQLPKSSVLWLCKRRPIERKMCTRVHACMYSACVFLIKQDIWDNTCRCKVCCLDWRAVRSVESGHCWLQATVQCCTWKSSSPCSLCPAHVSRTSH